MYSLGREVSVPKHMSVPYVLTTLYTLLLPLPVVVQPVTSITDSLAVPLLYVRPQYAANTVPLYDIGAHDCPQLPAVGTMRGRLSGGFTQTGTHVSRGCM